ncbi:Bacterial leucyl aminopeptidase [Aquicella siphonis]|uniref:Bacterial leucyl aminopeptidase n=1 Tax=Aquicella siphonis TaxID=254247 RepID=A0A5E4PGW1_9COXI|nr:M28 family peptidase [Aquicella siphonis]VVC75758.1 Bacterial leucyl aminopeptidase [Aquicella siphonis]
MITMPGTSYSGPFLPLSPSEKAISLKLKNHVTYLAGTLGERNSVYVKNYQAAAEYIEDTFRHFGLNVTDQKYIADDVMVRNIIAEKRGHSKPEEVIIIGAHYDTVYGSPGADDNASGVAAVMLLAELLKDKTLERTIRFIAFANEEPPIFYTSDMGSWRYARLMREKNENIVAMFSIESIGYYTEEENSQSYPPLLGLVYPARGNFIGFVGNLASRKLVQQVISIFRSQVSFPSEGIAAFSLIPGVSWSDHWSFWKHGYHAVMVTDTVPYRNPHYHLGTDRPDTLDYERMARVTNGLSNVMIELSGSAIDK